MPAIRNETVAAIGKLVAESTGLWVGPPLHRRLERLVERRLVLGHYRQPSEYYHFLRNNPYGAHEICKLASGLTARKPRLMNPDVVRLLKAAGTRLAGRSPAVLAVGTTAAEDIHTAAMVLDSAGADASAPDALLAAADIDLDRLLAGSTGVYTGRAVADVGANLLATWFEPMEHGRFRIRPRIRNRVQWLYVNPFDARPPVCLQWDIVLCRELLGRLTFSIHERWRQLGGLVAPGGLLICDRRLDFDGLLEAEQSGKYWSYSRPADAAIVLPPDTETQPGVAFERLLRIPAGESLDAAERELADALRVAPCDAARRAALGLAHLRRKRPAQASEEAANALQLAPHSPQVLFSCGIIYESLGKRATAEKLYRKTLFVQPSAAPVQLRLADLLVKCGRETDAGREYARAAQLLEQPQPQPQAQCAAS